VADPDSAVLRQPLTETDTVVALNNGREAWGPGSVLLLGGVEKVGVTSVISPNNLNVTRGFDDTAAAAWDVGTVVTFEENVTNNQEFLSNTPSVTGPVTGVAIVSGTALRVQGPPPEEQQAQAVQGTITPFADTPFFHPTLEPYDPRKASAEADARNQAAVYGEPMAPSTQTPEQPTQAPVLDTSEQQLPPQPLKSVRRK
jgi:hypothetical protein